MSVAVEKRFFQRLVGLFRYTSEAASARSPERKLMVRMSPLAQDQLSWRTFESKLSSPMYRDIGRTRSNRSSHPMKALNGF